MNNKWGLSPLLWVNVAFRGTIQLRQGKNTYGVLIKSYKGCIFGTEKGGEGWYYLTIRLPYITLDLCNFNRLCS